MIIFKKCLMPAVVLAALLATVAVFSAPLKFNALDKGDPHYAEFNRAICGYTADYIQRMDIKIQRLAVQYIELKTNQERLGWLDDFRTAAELKKHWETDYKTYCGK